VDYFLTEQYDNAEEIFKSRISLGTAEAAEAYYYLGEIAYAMGDSVKAKGFYEQGLAAAKSEFAKAVAEKQSEAQGVSDRLVQLNSVGLAQFAIAANRELGFDQLATIAKQKGAKKNTDVLVAIAKIYFAYNMEKQGEKTLAAAEKADKNSPLVFMFRGDQLMGSDNVGEAARQYQQAIVKNERYLVPHIKLAQIYVNVNPGAALSRLNEVKLIDSLYELVNRYEARAYTSLGYYDRAIAIQEKSFDLKTSKTSELTDYAAALFFADRYADATNLIDQGFQKSPDDFVLNRLKMYSEEKYLLGTVTQTWQRDSISLAQRDSAFAFDKADALQSARKFFTLKLRSKDKYIPLDYISCGNVLCENGMIDSAVVKYNKGIRMSNETTRDAEKIKVVNYKQISEALVRAKYPAQAAYYNDLYIVEMGAAGADISRADIFNTGRYLYLAAQKNYNMEMQGLDSLAFVAKQKDYLYQSDSIFGLIIDSLPNGSSDRYQPLLFRARVNSLRDPSAISGLAKPYYEEALGIILAKGNELTARDKQDLIRDIYRYLSYYYYVQLDHYNTLYEAKKDETNKAKALENKDKTLELCQKILDLDPKNSYALQITQALTPPPAPEPKKKK
jgi:tetratricopeptide (TPR) repeat protein